MMGTGWESIWSAGLLVSVDVSGNESVSLPVEERWVELSSVATISAGMAARHKIGGRDFSLELLVGSDTDSVRHGLSGGDSPA